MNLSEVHHRYIPVEDRDYRASIAERIVRKRLLEQHWQLWSTDYFFGRKHEYLFTEHSYPELCAMLERYKPGLTGYIEHLARAYHALPQLLAYKQGMCKFIVCKLEHESLGRAQRACILKLLEAEFCVEVYSLAGKHTKAVRATVDVQTGLQRVVEAQLTISAACRRAEKELSAARVQQIPVRSHSILQE
jgi:hypothetical protein